jgi:protein-tyrosine phosphatase
MENIYNFRDLGGIPTREGKKVKSGFFYRSSALDESSENDLKHLIECGIQCVLDFRESTEITGKAIYDRLGVAYHHTPMLLDSARILNLSNNRTLRNALNPLDKEDMRIGYRSLPFKNSGYKLLFDKVRQGILPVLFHCSVGKDRTGVAAALLLELLGAEREAIIEDYARSRVVEDVIANYITKKVFFLVRKPIKKAMEPVFMADPSYIVAALEAIDNKYGEISNYFFNEYGINQDEILRIRELYTE